MATHDRFVIGLFDDTNSAQQVVQGLKTAGFDSNHIDTIGSSDRSGLKSYLTKHGVPDSHAGFYSEGVRRGGTLVTVFSDDSRYAAAVELMRNHGAVDINKRAGYFKESGYNQYDESAANYTEAETTAERPKYDSHAGDEEVLQEIEENVHVGKEQVDRGGVRIFARKSEVPVERHVTLRDETINVHRENVDRPATDADLDAFKEGEVTLTETDERAVVSKEARVTGEVHVGKTVEEREEVVRDTARKTEVEVEEIAAGSTTTKP
jgi:stress response protein YsnF